MAKARDFRREYDTFHAKPEQKKRRAERNASRDKMVKAGAVKKGQDVHHVDGNTGNKSRKNLKAERPSKNRARK